jgi:integrase
VRGFGTIFRRNNSRFLWMQYWSHGERFRESTYCERPKEAKDILRRKLLELDRLGSPAIKSCAQPILVGDLYRTLEQDYVVNSRKSLPDLKIRWKKHLEPDFAALPVSSLTAQQVSVYIAKRIGEKAASATINRELALLKRAYKLAIKTGRLKYGEQPYFSMLRERNTRKGFVKDAQYSALARATGNIGLWLRALFEMGYCYGWRKSELLGMRVGQVDLIERSIVLHAGETKNEDGRTVEMTAAVYELLGGMVAGKSKDDFVFTRGKQNRPVKGFRKAWAKATLAAGCPGLLFHDLRRSGVRNLIRDGVTEKVAMTISGHKTRSVFERYNIVSQADMHRAVGLMNKGAASRRQASLFEQGELSFEHQDQTKKPAASVPALPGASQKIQ